MFDLNYYAGKIDVPSIETLLKNICVKLRMLKSWLTAGLC